MKILSISGRLLALPFCLFLLCHGASAQQNSPQKQDKPSTSTADRKKLKGVLGLVPTYDVTNGENNAPMTAKEKLRMAVDNSANSYEVVEAAIKAEYYRGTSPPKKIGHGATGYLKQWGASYLDEVSGNMFHTFLYPTLLHQDPRYYRKGGGSIIRRAAYSLSRVFVTRGDRGQTEFNASMVLGSATSTALSNAYYPPRSHDAEISIGNLGWSLVGDGASNVFKEFWPDIAQRLSKNR
ncbi:MAG: hypothetical protein ACRD2P_04545 [Terriglobia bacterium]